MKSRMCFVSNSSSSSFVCSICGNIESGIDASPSDFGMVSCDGCGNDYCQSCIERLEKYAVDYGTADRAKLFTERLRIERDDDESDDDEMRESCVICRGEAALPQDVIQFMVNNGHFEITKGALAHFLNSVKKHGLNKTVGKSLRQFKLPDIKLIRKNDD